MFKSSNTRSKEFKRARILHKCGKKTRYPSQGELSLLKPWGHALEKNKGSYRAFRWAKDNAVKAGKKRLGGETRIPGSIPRITCKKGSVGIIARVMAIIPTECPPYAPPIRAGSTGRRDVLKLISRFFPTQYIPSSTKTVVISDIVTEAILK